MRKCFQWLKYVTAKSKLFYDNLYELDPYIDLPAALDARALHHHPYRGDSSAGRPLCTQGTQQPKH